MAADHIAVPVDDRWGIETKGADRRHQLVKVLGSVLVRIARIDLQPVDRLVDDREPGGAGVRSISRVQDLVRHNKTPFDRARVLRSAGWRVAQRIAPPRPGIGLAAERGWYLGARRSCGGGAPAIVGGADRKAGARACGNKKPATREAGGPERFRVRCSGPKRSAAEYGDQGSERAASASSRPTVMLRGARGRQHVISPAVRPSPIAFSRGPARSIVQSRASPPRRMITNGGSPNSFWVSI